MKTSSARLSIIKQQNIIPLNKIPSLRTCIKISTFLMGAWIIVAMYLASQVGGSDGVPVPILSIPDAQLVVLTATLVFLGGAAITVMAVATYIFRHKQAVKNNAEKYELIEHLARHDFLTGFFNRGQAEELIDSAIEKSRGDASGFSLLFVDLDFFKKATDQLGHQGGDKLLRQFADRLRCCLQAKDPVVRVDDEFLILLTGERDVESVCRTILDVAKDPFCVSGEVANISASIGVSRFPKDGATANELLQRVDLALSEVKARGKGDYCFYEPVMLEAVAMERALEEEIRRGLAQNEFELHYQPQFSNQTQSIIGFEALIRWRHPEKGMVSPLTFIPAAERCGLIVEIGEWTIVEACKQAAAFKEEFGRDITVAVNLSSMQFKRSNLVSFVAQNLADFGLPGNCVELELTETLVMDNPNEAAATIKALKDLGVKISIDDFGTGYSSLSYIQKFEIDAVKIDQTFVRSIVTSSKDRAIVDAIIRLANGLGFHTVAEGVETKEQFDELHHLGCQAIQGFFFSKPVPAEEAADFVRGFCAKRANVIPMHRRA